MPDRLTAAVPLRAGWPRLAAAWLLLPAALALPAQARPSPTPEESPEIQRGYEKVAGDILCWCGCARQSVRDCTCGFSYKVRTEIESELKTGKTPDDIIARLVTEHGDQVRVIPVEAGFDRLAFIGPGIVIALGAVFILFVMRRWIKPAPPSPKPVPTDADLVRDDDYRARLAKTLSRMDS